MQRLQSTSSVSKGGGRLHVGRLWRSGARRRRLSMGGGGAPPRSAVRPHERRSKCSTTTLAGWPANSPASQLARSTSYPAVWRDAPLGRLPARLEKAACLNALLDPRQAGQRRMDWMEGWLAGRQRLRGSSHQRAGQQLSMGGTCVRGAPVVVFSRGLPISTWTLTWHVKDKAMLRRPVSFRSQTWCDTSMSHGHKCGLASHFATRFVFMKLLSHYY